MNKAELLIDVLRWYKESMKSVKPKNFTGKTLRGNDFIDDVIVYHCVNFDANGYIENIVVYFYDEYSSEFEKTLRNEFKEIGENLVINQFSNRVFVEAIFKN